MHDLLGPILRPVVVVGTYNRHHHVTLTKAPSVGLPPREQKTATLMSDSESFDEIGNLQRLSEMARHRIRAQSADERRHVDFLTPETNSQSHTEVEAVIETPPSNVSDLRRFSQEVIMFGDDDEIEADFEEDDLDRDSQAHESGDELEGRGISRQEDEDEEIDTTGEELSDDEPILYGDQDHSSYFLRGFVQRGTGGEQDASILDVMQRLVGGMENSPIERQKSEFNALIENLTQREEPFLILETLNELLERLLMMNGLTAERVIPSNRLAKALISVLKDPLLAEELELQVVACRCLYNFIEVEQDFIHDALNNHVIETLIAKLLEVAYIDLTEQCLQTLEVISKERGAQYHIIACNGLEACLRNLDFLTVHSQRKCLNIVANACNAIRSAQFPLISSQFDALASVVQHNDNQVIEYAWLAISRIVKSFKARPECLESLFADEHLLREMLIVIRGSCNPSGQEARLKFQPTVSLIKSLIDLASCSVKISTELFNLRVGSYLIESLNKFRKVKESTNSDQIPSMTSDVVSIEALVATPKEILTQFLRLIAIMLPITQRLNGLEPIQGTTIVNESAQEIDDLRVAACQDDASMYWHFVNDIWAILIRSFEASMDYELRRMILVSFFRIISSCEHDKLHRLREIESLFGILSTVISAGAQGNFTSTINPLQLHIPNKNSEQITLVSIATLIVKQLLLESYILYAPLLLKEGVLNDITILKLSLDTVLYQDCSPELIPNDKNSDNVERELPLSSERVKFTIFEVLSQLHNTTKDILKVQEEQVAVLGSGSESLAEDLANFHTLSNTVKGSGSELDWNAVWRMLLNILGTSERGISSFELVSLSIIAIMTDLLQSDNYTNSTDLARSSFAQLFYGEPQPVLRLVDLLHECLTRTDSFEALTSGTASTGSGGYATSMVRQIRLRLIADESLDEIVPEKMRQVVLSVHAIATFSSVEKFISQRFEFMNLIGGSWLSGNPFSLLHDDGEQQENKESWKSSNMHFYFSTPGPEILSDTTVFGAVYRMLQSESQDRRFDSQDVWNKCHTVRYRHDPDLPQKTVPDDTNNDSSLDPTTESILSLLKILLSINDEIKQRGYLEPLEASRFTNWKLTVKLNRQLDEPLIVASGILPDWTINITKEFPFIFPLNSRMNFLQSTSFGHSRLIHNWQKRFNGESSEESRAASILGGNYGGLSLGRQLRRKIRISRTHIFQSALKILQSYGNTPGVLEIEYFDEIGSGLGPTLEFYSSVSKEFCKLRLSLWRTDSEGEFVFNPNGLFPRPISPKGEKDKDKIRFLFHSLGKFIARSLLDSRIVDFDFNPVFLAFVRDPFEFKNQYFSADAKLEPKLELLKQVDPELCKSLKHLLRYADIGTTAETVVDGNTLSDLCLTFLLPGYGSYELLPNADEITVSPSNLTQYVNLVLDATLYDGVLMQVKALLEGFSEVFPISSMKIFSPVELREFLGKASEDWSVKAISGSIKADHGYSQDLKSIERLAQVMGEFNLEERREFLQFLTGSPKLPIGGFMAIRPEFTVVKKQPEDGLTSDDYLPSVMTCVNYLKLPDYSLASVMKAKLLHAMREGAGAFHLS